MITIISGTNRQGEQHKKIAKQYGRFLTDRNVAHPDTCIR